MELHRTPSARQPERRTAKLSAVTLVFALAGCATTPPATAPESLAIVGVTIVDPTSTEPPLAEQTILIQNGEIQLIGPTAAVTYPAGTRQIDGHGKFAIPGLWDAHVHFMNTGVSALALYIANGITSVREMGGYIDSTRAWQARMRAGALVGPRIVTPGPMLESPSYLQRVVQRSQRLDPRLAARILPYRIGVRDSMEARRAIDSLRKLHVDFVKFRTTASPEAVYGILRYARSARLRVAGHQPVVPIGNALDSGFSDMQHAFLPPLSRLSPAGRDSVYRKFIENEAWYTPTLVVTRSVLLTGDSAERAVFGPDAMRLDERRRYAAPILLDWWRMQIDERKGDTSARRLAVFNEVYRSSVSDVQRMRELGVKILAGTDAGSVLIYPGFSLHDELQRLVDDAKLTPSQALWSATVGPAQFAGLDDKLGTIAAGKIADLVLLDADPLSDIRNTRRIFGVMQAGRWFARADLDALLAQVRNEVAASANAPPK